MNFIIIVKQYLTFDNDFKSAFYGSPYYKYNKEAFEYRLACSYKFKSDIKSIMYNFWRGYLHGNITTNFASYYGHALKLDNKDLAIDDIPACIIQFISKCYINSIELPINEVFTKILIPMACSGIIKYKMNYIPANNGFYVDEAIQYEVFNYLDKCSSTFISYRLSTLPAINSEKMIEYLISRRIKTIEVGSVKLAIKYNLFDNYLKQIKDDHKKIMEAAEYIDLKDIDLEYILRQCSCGKLSAQISKLYLLANSR